MAGGSHQGNLDSTELLTEGASAWVYSGVLPLATAGLRAATLDNKLIITVAGSPGRVKSTFKYGDPLKIFVLMYKKILRKEIFHFEASYYPSQHTPHLPSSLS